MESLFQSEAWAIGCKEGGNYKSYMLEFLGYENKKWVQLWPLHSIKSISLHYMN